MNCTYTVHIGYNMNCTYRLINTVHILYCYILSTLYIYFTATYTVYIHGTTTTLLINTIHILYTVHIRSIPYRGLIYSYSDEHQ